MVWYGMVWWHCIVLYGMVWYGMIWWHCMVWYGGMVYMILYIGLVRQGIKMHCTFISLNIQVQIIIGNLNELNLWLDHCTEHA